jgi:carboxymethylenebutenolidase
MSTGDLTAETVRINGYNGDDIEAYLARPSGVDGRLPGVVIIHHAPGYDPGQKEIARNFAAHGYLCLMPNLYSRSGEGEFDDIAAAIRAQGGVSDDQVVGDVEAAAAHIRALPNSNQKIGIIGYCSGGRQVYVCACRIPTLNAAVDCYGGGVVAQPEQITPNRPVSPITMSSQIVAPLLGLFGKDDRNPDQAMVATIDAELTKLGKTHEFHSYDGAGHAFFHPDRVSFRQDAASDGWQQIWAWYGKHLAS